MDEANKTDLVELTAEIISAYVSNNTVVPEALPAVIADVHEALSKAAQRIGPAEREELRPAVARQEIRHARLHRLPGGRKEVQVFEAASAHPLQSLARGIPREVGPAARLPDGCTELRGRPLAARQADGSRHAAREVGCSGSTCASADQPRSRSRARKGAPQLLLVGPEQLRVAGEIIGPMPGQPALPLGPQGSAQLRDNQQSSGQAIVLDLLRP